MPSGPPGSTHFIGLTRLWIASDLGNINRERIGVLRSYRITDPMLEKDYSLSLKYLANARAALEKRNYEEAYSYSMLAWMYADKVYLELMSAVFSASGTAVFLLALTIPFAFLLERLVFEENARRLLGEGD